MLGYSIGKDIEQYVLCTKLLHLNHYIFLTFTTILNYDFDFLGTATIQSTYGTASNILFDDFHCTGK